MTDYFKLATELARGVAAGHIAYHENEPWKRHTASPPCLDSSTAICVPPAADDPVRKFWASQGVAIVERCIYCHREIAPR